MEAVETFDVQGLRVSLFYDPDPESPASWDTLGTLRTWLDRYNLGHGEASDPADAPDDPAEWPDFLDAAGAVYLPVYAYIHGGITISTGAFACPWDSGQAGFIYAMPEAIRETFGADVDPADPATRERVAEGLRAEVAEWDRFCTGDVWGYEVERVEPCGTDCEGAGCYGPHDTEHLDSCWGFYGRDAAEPEAREAAEWEANRPAREAAEAYARSYVGRCAAALKGGTA